MAGNSIQELPADLFMLSRLMTLNLAANSLPSVPTAVSSLTRLCNLSLEQNNITALPTFLTRLVSLRVNFFATVRTNQSHSHCTSIGTLWPRWIPACET